MKSLRLLRWSGSVLLRTRPCCIQRQCQHRLPPSPARRSLSNASTPLHRDDDSQEISPLASPAARPVRSKGKRQHIQEEKSRTSRSLPSPPPSLASRSAKLSALHARLSLPPRLPVETLARCLIDPSADPNSHFNNTGLSLLGGDLLGYCASEGVICRYPRLPSGIVVAAMNAYCGETSLASLAKEWGVESAAAPGEEVDPGLLQYTPEGQDAFPVRLTHEEEPEEKGWRRGTSSKDISQTNKGPAKSKPSRSDSSSSDWSRGSRIQTPKQSLPTQIRGISRPVASSNFVRALFGALYLHTGLRQTKTFYNAHIASRHLDYSALFSFVQPTRDLSRLCAREGFESPTARILSETGRRTRHPVFVVGIFSGREKLGEGSGASLDEARIRAAVNTLKGWYLYSPLNVRVPSEVFGGGGKEWEPVMIDGGEVIV